MVHIVQMSVAWSAIGVMLAVAFVLAVYSRFVFLGRRAITMHAVIYYIIVATSMLMAFTGVGPPHTPAASFILLAFASATLFAASTFAVHVKSDVLHMATLGYAVSYLTYAMAAAHPSTVASLSKIGMIIGGFTISMWAVFVLYDYFTTRDLGFAWGVSAALATRNVVVFVPVLFGTAGLGQLDEISEGIFVVSVDAMISTLVFAYITWAYAGDAGRMGEAYIDESLMTPTDDPSLMYKRERKSLL